MTCGASARVIDDFSQGPLSLHATNFTGVTVTQSGLDPASVLGGSRVVYAGSLSNGNLTIDPIKTRFRFTSDASFGYFRVGWGETSVLDVNLRSDGSDRFVLDVLDLTPGVTSGLYDFKVRSGGVWFTYDFLPDLQAISVTGPLVIPFARFGGADFTHVQGVEISVGRFPSQSGISIDGIRTVPEPSSIALLGIASGGLLLVRCVARRTALAGRTLNGVLLH
jgi:hypothetical protein